MNRIVIDSGIRENKVAILENDELVDMYVDRIDDQRITGNIYLGRVVNILPGMQAAFIDIGLKKNAFIHLRDVLSRSVVEKEDFNISDFRIEDVIKQGQDILVQIQKEAFNTKGPKASTQLSLTGKYVAIMDGTDYIGVSRKIQKSTERERLRNIASKYTYDNMGVVVRTISDGEDECKIAEDISYLVKKLKGIKQSAKISRPPKLISGLGIEQKIIRDFLNDNIDEIVLNDVELYKSLIQTFKAMFDESVKKLVFFDKSSDIFSYFGIDKMMESALEREVALSSGGSIVIDETEALTIIDVNSGKFIGDKNLSDTVLKVNIEAAKEIGKQLRLRNIGGIVIIDFIDMKKEKDVKIVLEALKDEMKKDVNTTNILGMTKLGLVEMTRRKTIGRLTTRMLRKCPCCEGLGKVTSESVVINNIENEAKKAFKNTKAKCMAIEVNPIVIDYIEDKCKNLFKDIERYYDIKVIIVANKEMDYGAHRIIRMGSIEFVENHLKENY